MEYPSNREIIRENDPDWTPEQKAILSQTSFGFDTKAPKAEFEKIPFEFFYEFSCASAGCKGHKMICTDWEILGFGALRYGVSMAWLRELGRIRLKREIKIVATVLVICVAGIAALRVFDPFALLALEVAVFGTGHPYNPPPLAEGKTFDWRNSWPNNPAWTAILRRHFPVGSSVSELVAVLRAQGFAVDTSHATASYEWGEFPCLDTLTADWSAENHKIVSLSGRYSSACL